MNSRKVAMLILGYILITTFISSAEPILGILGGNQKSISCEQESHLSQASLPSTIEDAKALYNNCSCYTEKKDFAAARECYAKVKDCTEIILIESPSDLAALALMTDAEDRIHELYGDIYKLPPGSNCTCVKNSSYDSIIAGYNNAIRLDPGSARAWNDLGVLLGELCCMKDARASFDEAILINSSLAEPLYNKGVSLFYESPREALECFNRSLELDPELAEAWFNRYPLLMPSYIDMTNLTYRQAYNEAMASYNRSLELKPDLGLYKPPYLIYKRIE